MPVPSAITDLSVIPGSNYPSGTESPSTLDDYLRTHAAFIAQNYVDREMPGVVKHFAGAAAPTGWLACSGQAVSRATYAALFAAIGTTWGVGDGSTTFNLPDSRNRVLIGSGGLYAVGAVGGSKDAVVVSHSHTGTAAAVGDHTHSENRVTSVGSSSSYGTGAQLGVSVVNSGAWTTGAGGGHSHTITADAVGVSGVDANLPPYAAMMVLIKT